MEHMEDELQVDHGRTFGDGLDDDTADEELDDTELASVDWLEIHYGKRHLLDNTGFSRLMMETRAWATTASTARSACGRRRTSRRELG
jgi:hypothetical protein